MELEELLKEFDLTDSETKLYLKLLNVGSGTASSIAKKAKVHRRLAYDNFKSLSQKGLVSYVDKENKRIYKPVNPKRLEELIDERRKNLKELEEKLETALPNLIAKYKSKGKESREVKILEGKEGIKTLFNDEIRQGEKIYLIGTPKESEEILKYFLPGYTRKRKEKEIKIKGIFEHKMKEIVKKKKSIEAQFLPKDYKSDVSISIYGNKTGIIFWIEEPLVIMIKDEEAANSFMNYFKLIWEAARNNEKI